VQTSTTPEVENAGEMPVQSRPASNDIFYVAPSGDNNNPGTREQPWATPGYASKQLAPGNTLVILGGRYIIGQDYDDIITPTSGSADAWITIRGEYGNIPALAGRDNLRTAIDLSGVSYVKIENLEITSDDGKHFREGINAWEPASHIIFKNLHIHHLDEMGIDLKDINDLQMIDCNIHHCGFGAVGGPAGEQGGWRNVMINGCQLSYSGHYYQGGKGPSPYDRPDGFGIEPSKGPVEIMCTIAEHNLGDGLDSKAENTFIHNCIVANNSCDGIKIWGDGSKIENCLIYGTGDGDTTPTPWAGLVIDQVEKTNARFEVMNTTVHDNAERQGYPVYVQYENPTPVTLVMRNCIVANGEGPVYIGDSVKFTSEHNIFYRPGQEIQVYANKRNYTSTQINSGELGTGNISQDPLFISPSWGHEGNYHLSNKSPAINGGTSQAAPTTDLDGKKRPQGNGYDIGCYEQ